MSRDVQRSVENMSIIGEDAKNDYVPLIDDPTVDKLFNPDRLIFSEMLRESIRDTYLNILSKKPAEPLRLGTKNEILDNTPINILSKRSSEALSNADESPEIPPSPKKIFCTEHSGEDGSNRRVTRSSSKSALEDSQSKRAAASKAKSSGKESPGKRAASSKAESSGKESPGKRAASSKAESSGKESPGKRAASSKAESSGKESPGKRAAPCETESNGKDSPSKQPARERIGSAGEGSQPGSSEIAIGLSPVEKTTHSKSQYRRDNIHLITLLEDTSSKSAPDTDFIKNLLEANSLKDAPDRDSINKLTEVKSLEDAPDKDSMIRISPFNEREGELQKLLSIIRPLAALKTITLYNTMEEEEISSAKSLATASEEASQPSQQDRNAELVFAEELLKLEKGVGKVLLNCMALVNMVYSFNISRDQRAANNLDINVKNHEDEIKKLVKEENNIEKRIQDYFKTKIKGEKRCQVESDHTIAAQQYVRNILIKTDLLVKRLKTELTKYLSIYRDPRKEASKPSSTG